MKLSLREYDAMQSGWRKWINEHMEIGGFKAWGMDFTGKDILEVGCGSGYSASLIVKDHPKSYTGMDIMPESTGNSFDSQLWTVPAETAAAETAAATETETAAATETAPAETAAAGAF